MASRDHRSRSRSPYRRDRDDPPRSRSPHKRDPVRSRSPSRRDKRRRSHHSSRHDKQHRSHHSSHHGKDDRPHHSSRADPYSSHYSRHRSIKRRRTASPPPSNHTVSHANTYPAAAATEPTVEIEDNSSESSETSIGPALPPGHASSRPAGPTIPNAQDLELRNDLMREEAANNLADLRHARKTDRKVQKERLGELVPCAEPGSRERQLEKKRETAASMRSFRDAKSPGAEEVGERDLMGDDGLEGYKKRKELAERKKTDREIRREEMMRVRAAEREERLAEHREKEAKTVAMLRELARQHGHKVD